MRILTATLSINDNLDPPTAGLTVELDGAPPVLQSDDVVPVDLVATLAALSEIVGVELLPLLAGQIAAVVAKIEGQVTTGQAQQERREAALLAWQQATA